MTSESREVRVGINGFGRIGRCAFKHLVARRGFSVAAVNDLSDRSDLAYLLKYDSVHGWYERKVAETEAGFSVDGQEVPFYAQKEPSRIPWGEVGADVVLECTGAFRDRDKAAGHLAGGASRVVISAPSDNADATFVLGVNEDTYDAARHRVVSMASCTTNSLAPVVKVLHQAFGVEEVILTTVHAYTSSQSLMDTPARKRRRGRAAALSIIPTTTGAAKATEKVLPELAGKMDGLALRVPVPDGSLSDIVARLGRQVTAEEVNRALSEAASRPPLRGVLRVSDEALVSRDIVGDPHSSIVDAEHTRVVGGKTVKVLAWYDNEWGYAARLVDLAALMVREGL